jgi:hypothetical protein
VPALRDEVSFENLNPFLTSKGMLQRPLDAEGLLLMEIVSVGMLTSKKTQPLSILDGPKRIARPSLELSLESVTDAKYFCRWGRTGWLKIHTCSV